MSTQTLRADRFLALHRPGRPLLLPNPWDPGTARILASLGFEALATTSSGHAATSGRLDGSVTREEAIAHAAAIVEATELPVSADLENCFADDLDGVAQTIRLALAAGLAGCSIEDHTRRDDAPIYDLPRAVERVAAAAEVAHGGAVHLVLTARAENYLHGRPDLADTIARLQAYQEAGADVLYAPGLSSLEDIRQLVSSVDRAGERPRHPGRAAGRGARRDRREPRIGRGRLCLRRPRRTRRGGHRTAVRGHLRVPRTHRGRVARGASCIWRLTPLLGRRADPHDAQRLEHSLVGCIRHELERPAALRARHRLIDQRGSAACKQSSAAFAAAHLAIRVHQIDREPTLLLRGHGRRVAPAFPETRASGLLEPATSQRASSLVR